MWREQHDVAAAARPPVPVPNRTLHPARRSRLDPDGDPLRAARNLPASPLTNTHVMYTFALPTSGVQATVGFDRMMRRLFPSTARLSFNPLFKAAVDCFDLLPRLAFPELTARLPPNHLRIRVGVGNRFFANYLNFVVAPTVFWMHAFHAGLCRLNSTIVDIGCGCGRSALVLRDYKYKMERFAGSYIGIDVDKEMLEWCRTHFDRERFEFHHSPHVSRAYRAAGDKNEYYRLPLADNSVDFVFSVSLFSHLLEREVANYCRESWRVLKEGQHMLMYFFSMDRLPPTYGDRHTFRFQVGNAHVESLAIPEAAVAYHEAYLMSVAREAGFSSAEVQMAPGDWQPILLCRK